MNSEGSLTNAFHGKVCYIADLHSYFGVKCMVTRQKQHLGRGCKKISAVTHIIHQGVAWVLMVSTIGFVEWFHIVDPSISVQ